MTPVYVQSTERQDMALLNVLVAGYRVDALVAQQLKNGHRQRIPVPDARRR